MNAQSGALALGGQNPAYSIPKSTFFMDESVGLSSRRNRLTGSTGAISPTTSVAFERVPPND